MRLTTALLILPLLTLAACANPFGSAPTDAVVMCATDTQTCPDGSTVARDPAQNCSFKTCQPMPTTTKDAATITTAEIGKLTLDCAGSGQTACPIAGDTVVRMTTTKGDVWLRLFPSDTPKTVENFTGLIERGYYDGLIFHRVIPDFMIQGGDPTGTGMGGASIWGGTFADEFVDNLTNIRGTLSMANAGPGTNGSQFFIVQKEGGTPWLDGHHTVFGQVIAGMDVVDAIATVEADGSDKPLADVKMEKLSVMKVK